MSDTPVRAAADLIDAASVGLVAFFAGRAKLSMMVLRSQRILLLKTGITSIRSEAAPGDTK